VLRGGCAFILFNPGLSPLKRREAQAVLQKIIDLGEKLEQETDPLYTGVWRSNRLTLLQGLQEAYLGKIIHSLLNLLPTRGRSIIPPQDKVDFFIFEQTYGQRPEVLNNNLATAREKFHEALGKFDAEIINSQRLTAIKVKDRKGFQKYLEEHNLGFYYGTAKVLSTAERGRFVSYMGQEFITQGIDAKFTRGLKNEHDQSLVTAYLTALMVEEDRTKAIEIVRKDVEDLWHHRLDPKSLLYVTPEIKRDYLDYKDRSMLSREIAIRIKHAQEKGRWFAWGYVKGGEVAMPDFLEHEYDEQQYFKMLFGEPKDNGWNFRSYAIQTQRGKEVKTIKPRTIFGGLLESTLVYNTDSPSLQKKKRKALIGLLTQKFSDADKEILLM